MPCAPSCFKIGYRLTRSPTLQSNEWETSRSTRLMPRTSSSVSLEGFVAVREIIWVVLNDGEKIGFEVLSVRQIVVASELVEARARKAVLDDCKAVGASPEVQLEALRKVRADSQGMHELVKHCFTWQGALDIIGLSDEAKAARAVESLGPTDICRLALRLINHEIDGEGKLQSRSAGTVSG